MATEVGQAYVDVQARLNRASVAATKKMLSTEMASAAQQVNAAIVRGLSPAMQHATNTQLAAVTNELRKNFPKFYNAGQQAGNQFGSGFKQSLAGFKQTIASVNSAAAGATQQMLRSIGQVGQALGILSTRVGVLGFQFQILGAAITRYFTVPMGLAVGLTTAFGLKTAMGIEVATTSLKALLPVGTNVVALMDRLQKFSAASPAFGLDDVIGIVRTLVGSGVELKKSEQILDALNKIFITYGVTGPAAEKAVLGVGQVFRKGKAYAEELTQQIGEQIPIWALIGKAIGKTQAEVMAMVKNGEVTSEMFAEWLLKIGQLPEVLKGAQEGTKTLDAQWNMLKETLSQRLAKGFLDNFPAIKKALKDLEPVLLTLVDILVKNLPGAIEKVGKFVAKLLEIKKAWDDLGEEKQDKILKLVAALAAAGPGLTSVGFAFTTISTAVGGLATALTFLSTPIGIVLGGLLAVGAAIFYGYQKSEEFRKGVNVFVTEFSKGWEEKVKPAFEELQKSIEEDLMPALENLLKALGFDSWEELGKWLGENLPNAIAFFIEGITANIAMISSWINWIVDLIEFGKKIWNWLDETLSKIELFKRVAITVVSEWVEGTKTKIEDLVASGIEKFERFKTKISDIVTGIKDFWLDKWNSIADGMLDGANKIINFLNSVIDKVNKILPSGSGISKIATFATGGAADTGSRSRGIQQFATGGSVFGPGTGTSDSIPALLSNGEHVWTAAEVKAAGGHGMMELLRKSVLEGTGPAKRYLGYAAGGGVGVASVNALTSLVNSIGVPFSISSSFRDTNDYHGSGNAIDIVSDQAGMIQIASWFMRNMGSRLLELLHSGGGGFWIKNGRPVDASYYASEIPNHYSHVHVAATLASLAGLGGGFPGGNMISGAIEKIFSGVSGPFKKLLGGMDGLGGKALGGIFGGALDALKGKASSMFGFSPVAGGAGATVGGQLSDWMNQALSILGLPQSWFGPLHTLIQRESSGNPRTINTWDSNAMMGDPSRGLMQTIGATFNAYKLPGLSNDIYDPVSNIVAGLRYIQARYGSIFNVQQANASLPPMGYDYGGTLMPGQAGMNYGSRPEFILNPAQAAALESRIAGGDQPIYVTVLVDGVEMLARVVVDRENKDTARSLTAGGGI